MTLSNYFFPQGDLQTVVNYDSFEVASMSSSLIHSP